jgi:hypothetical protein
MAVVPPTIRTTKDALKHLLKGDRLISCHGEPWRLLYADLEVVETVVQALQTSGHCAAIAPGQLVQQGDALPGIGGGSQTWVWRRTPGEEEIDSDERDS